MNRRPLAMILCACLAAGLTGCVAAVVPLAAGGLIGRKVVRPARRDPGPTDAADARGRDAPRAGAAPAIAALPADPAAMTPGTVYAGEAPMPTSMPMPTPRLPAPAIPPGDVAPTAAADWSDVLHHVARLAGATPADSVLPVRSAGGAARRWVPCGDRPPAVVADLDAAGAAGASEYLGAMEALGFTLVYTTRLAPAASARTVEALRRADLHRPVAGTTLIPVAPGREAGVRAAIGMRYCVVAIAGGSAADLPDAPGANPGWFLIGRR